MVLVFTSDALYRLVSLKYGLLNLPGLTTVAYKNLACSSGQSWMEKILFCQLFVCLCPYPGPNSILDSLPDLSSLQWRGDPFCSQQWPGSVCVDHYYELLRPPDAIQVLRPSVTSHYKQAPGRCSPSGVVKCVAVAAVVVLVECGVVSSRRKSGVHVPASCPQ